MTEPATQAERAWDTTPMPARRRARTAALTVLAAISVLGGGVVSAALVRPTPAPPAASPAGASAPLPYGAGPQRVYRVQPQPPAGSCRYRHTDAGTFPDPACTPGALNPDVTPATLKTTICRPGGGYTDGIRPPQSVTGREKQANARAYGYSGVWKTAEYDHWVPLSLGGDPNDARNLWVEPNDDPDATSTRNPKDDVELAAQRAVCAGRISLARAQYLAATDWTALAREVAR